MSDLRELSAEMRSRLLVVHDCASRLSDLSDLSIEETDPVTSHRLLTIVGDIHYRVMRATEDLILSTETIIDELEPSPPRQLQSPGALLIGSVILLFMLSFPLALLVIHGV
jgi:hypothetical protein